ncbi:MAG TPA: hypothetical protein VKT28_05750 [Puia sp.]|nr:hypothetical protein [Puia sp.]
MKKNLLLILLCSIGIIYSGCNVKNNLISNLWFYTHSSNNNDVHDALLTPASFIYLKPDGTYTKDFGSFEYGRWKFDNSELQLTNSKNEASTLVVKKIGINDMELLGNNDVVSNFEKQPASFSSDADNPFSKQNNEWRIRAAHKETDSELKSRLRNHCKFWETYFEWALKNHIDYIDVRSTPTSIKIYGNGFTLKPFEDLPKPWRSYFFDEDDCMKANDIIKDIFTHKNISWAHSDNKYKMFISAFQQMEQMLL